MRKAFKASRLIGLLALGLMTFGATAAQAHPGAHWDVEGAEISGALLPEVHAKLSTAVTTLLTKVSKTTVEILCTALSLKGARLHELGRATGKIHYSGCKTSLNKGGHVKNCEPKSPGAPLGLIETNALEGLIKLHELAGGAKDELLELKPVTGTSFVTIELGPLCPIGNKFDVTGPAFIKDSQLEGNVEKKEHEFEEGPLTALLFGGNEAKIQGKALGALAGAHAGMNFSGHAN